eukprot:g2273.t1
MTKGGIGSPPCGRRNLASVLWGVPNMLQRVVCAGIVFQTAGASTSSPTATSVAVNRGLLVTGSVHFGVVPVPNLCVELRGYDPAAAEEASASESASASASASTSGPPNAGNGKDDDNGNGVATASVTPGHSWHSWGEGKPKFLELQRTGETDGSFAFVTPESGVVLVVAAYPHSGENPIVRVFPDDSRKGTGHISDQVTDLVANGGEASAFGTDSGRVQMHIDLSESTHAPEVLWSASSSAAARGRDRSPCARHDAAAAGEEAPSAPQRNGWSLGEEVSRRYHGVGGEEKVNQDQAGVEVALTALLRSSLRYLRELHSSCWAASAAVRASFRSRLEATGQRVHRSALAAAMASSEWFETARHSSRWALFSPTTMLFNRLQQRLGSTHFWAWFGDLEEFSTRLISWMEWEQRGSVTLRTWWSVWWVRVVAIALLLVILQEAFVCVYKYFRSGAAAEEVAAAVPDSRCPGSRSQDQDQDQCQGQGQDSVGATSTVVGTLYSSDGKACQLDFGKFAHLEEPATVKGKGRRIFEAVWGGNSGTSTSTSISTSGRRKLADSISGGSQEQEQAKDKADDFSSMFRALSQASCSLTGIPGENDDGVSLGGGATSNVVVVTHQS